MFQPAHCNAVTGNYCHFSQILSTKGLISNKSKHMLHPLRVFLLALCLEAYLASGCSHRNMQ